MNCYNTTSRLYKRCLEPWLHWEISDFFTIETIREIYSIMKQNVFLHAHDSSIHHSWTKNNNRYEYMLSRELYNTNPFIKEVVDQFKSNDNIEYLEFLTKKKLTGGRMLRMSIWKDVPGYKLSPHPDSTYKLLTTQIYLPIDEEEESHLGTSMYDQNIKEAKRVDFKKNCGYMFSPCHDDGCVTHHGLEGVVDMTRYSFMINIFDKQKFESKMRSKNDLFPEENAWHIL